jgi:hypothetical protein
MTTVYDWSTMIVFAGLVVLFLQQSQGEARDQLWHYLVAAVGCAGTNYLGNEGYHLVAVAAGVATLAFIFVVLRPLDSFNS